MAVYASLLSTVPIPQQQWQTKSQIPVVASVKVGDIVCDDAKNNGRSFFARYIDALKNKILENRIKKLELRISYLEQEKNNNYIEPDNKMYMI